MARTDNPDSLTLTVPEAARLLNIGRDQVYKAAEIGELPSIRIGRRVLVLARPLKAMLQAGE